jgi:predicted amidohydrolase YtcJ
LAGNGAARVDLGGATVMPGLIDTHPHVLHFGGLTHHLVEISDATSHADIVERVRTEAAKTVAGTWIQCTPVGEPHYFIRRSWRDLEEGCLPDRRVLDQATADHPVLIQAWAPVIPNVCSMNTAALAALGLTRDTPDRVDNVTIEKDANGDPTGVLRGSVNNYYTNDPFMNSLMLQIPMFEPASVLAGTRSAMGEYNRMGVTTAYEGHAMGLLEMEVYKTLHTEGALSLRVLTALEAESYGLPWTQSLTDEAFDANLELALTMTSVSDDLLRSNGVTLSRGGPCWPGFLRMNEPYTGPYGDKTRGVTFVSGEKEERAIEFCTEEGLRLNFIGAGDRDHDEFLDRAEAAAARCPNIRDRHWILQHAYLMSEEHCRRYAALGFDVTTSMSFCWGKGDMMADRIGEHVWNDLIPLARLQKHGMTVGCGSDWGPKNIFEQIALAETHEFCGSGHRNLGPGQPVSRDQALLMWTRYAATVLQWDGIGTLAPGNHADMIVVDRNPAECPNEDLAGTKVMRTLLGGKVVHDDGSL